MQKLLNIVYKQSFNINMLLNNVAKVILIHQVLCSNPRFQIMDFNH